MWSLPRILCVATFKVSYAIIVMALAVFARRYRRVSLGDVTADSWD